MPSLDTLNALAREEAERELLRCCGSRRWAEAMAAARPFRDREALHAAAARLWEGLGPEDWLEAFAHHPRIGERSRADGWARQEQSGTRSAATGVLARLAKGNEEYEKKFGHVFLVCATGKTAEEMLALLEKRLAHSPEEELRIAAGEQAKITRLRLEKWLNEGT